MSAMELETENLSPLDTLADNALAEFKQLVIDYAEGREPSLKKIRDTLALVGKSIDDFKKQVELLQKRLAAAEVIERHPDQQAEVNAIAVAVEAAKTELDQLEKEYREKRHPIQTRHLNLTNELTSQSSVVQRGRADAISVLARTSDPSILKRRHEILSRQAKFVGLNRSVIDGPEATKERAEIQAELLELEKRENDPVDGLNWQ